MNDILNQENFNRDFKGVWIPKEVWLDDRLSALDKIILTEIDSLDQGEDGCFASNDYIANFCQCSSTKVSTSITKLIEYDYLYVRKFDGRKRYLKSRLSFFERQDLKKCKAGFKKIKDINTSNNTPTNTFKKERKKEEKITGYDEIINSMVDDPNLKNAIYEFIKMRKLIKKPMTDRALTMLINKLNKLSSDKYIQIKIIEKSILKNWSDIYPYKEEVNNEINRRSNKRDGSEFSEYD